MRAIDLEARVLAAVDQIRAGGSVESDFIECKREWPQDKKARQLAGSLNRAGGDPVIYIIGIDEKTGEIFDVGDTEVSNWWTQLAAKFDQAAPEMVRHMSVPVGDGGQAVIAAAFASDRAPYVVKTGLQDPNLEIPMREGTRTRTARRDELLRLLIPTVKVPPVVVLSGRLDATFYPAMRTDAGQGNVRVVQPSIECRGLIKLYFEHGGRELVTLPAHGMKGNLRFADTSYPIKILPDAYHSDEQKSRPQFGVVRTREAIVVNGPAAAGVHLVLDKLSPELRAEIASTDAVPVELELDVLDALKPLRVSVTMEKAPSRPYHMVDPDTVGSWVFKHPNLPDL